MPRTFLSFIALAFFTVTHLSFSQKEKDATYIITQQNDTIHGFVHFKDLSKNPTKIKFKQSLESEEKVLRPGDIHQLSLMVTTILAESLKSKKALTPKVIFLILLN